MPLTQRRCNVVFMVNQRILKAPLLVLAFLLLFGTAISTPVPSVSAVLFGDLDNDTGLCANIGSGYDRPDSYPTGWPERDQFAGLSWPPTIIKVPVEGGATNWHCRTDTGLTTGGQSCIGQNGQSVCVGGQWSSTFPVGTPVFIGKQDIETRTNGGSFARSLVSVEWDFDGNGTYETVDNGPWLSAFGTSTCSGGGCTYITRETRATYFEGTTTFSTPGLHTVGLRARYSDGSTQSSSGVFTATVDSVSAVISRATTNGGPGTATTPVLTGTDVYLTASSSTTTSGYFSKFEWDVDNDGVFETDTGTRNSHTVSFSTPGNKTVAVRITSRGGTVRTASTVVEVRQAPPSGEPGVSINDGATATNQKAVTLNLAWPEYATEARISNDGGFAPSKTKVVPLSKDIDWELDDSIKGLFTKVVYVRFNGSGIDNTKTYSDDIILDTTAPVISNASAVASSANLDVKISAKDDITGVEKIQVDNGQKSFTRNYSENVKVPLSALDLSVSTASVSKSSVKTMRIRVSDGAGNWTKWRTVNLTGKPVKVVANPSGSRSLTLGTKKKVSGKTLAKSLGLKVASSSKISVKVSAASKENCGVTKGSVQGLKAGKCKVTVTVKPIAGKSVSKTLTLTIS